MGKRSILYVHVIVWALILERITGNSFPPEILNGNVNERIPENTKFGVTVATVTASDRDPQFPDNEIRFRMFAVKPTLDFFAIETETGNIFLKRDLTTDTSDTYQMYVQAYDMGSPSKTSATNATVTIDVYRNLRDPFFSGGPFAANIPETSVIGTSVLQINFGDSDTDAPFNTVTVSAIGDDKALTYFRLESYRQIVVNSDLKADSDFQYLMRILAQDGGSPPRTATTVATITVQRNINSPVFERQSYNETILETRQLGLSFLQVKATDGDTRVPYNEVRYLISSDAGSALGAQYFIVDDVTGDISLRQSPKLDNAKTVDYTFTVNAVDRGGRSATIPASVRVTVIRNTNAPVFTNLPNANQINHNTSIGTQVFQVSARDPDPGVFGQLTYSLTGDGESTSVFDINRTSGVITLQQSLFSQTSTLYTLRVRVQDGGSPRKEAMNTLTLTVQRNFETPRFVSNSYTFTIKENEPIGFSVGQIVATDADSAPPNNLVEYYFVGSTPSQRFLIDSRTGVITIRKDLTTEETPSSYTFRVQARDSGSPQRLSQEIPLTINVQRNDYDPLFGNLPFSVTIPANANQFSTVYTVNSTDADTVLDFQRREYDIIGDDAATSLFAVDATAGRITISSLLTSDPAVQYRVRVRVRDFGTPRHSSTSLLLVNVTRNLNAPQFNPTQYFATILETQPLGSNIQQVSSSDLDTTAPNNVPTYTLSGNALALQYFQVNPSTGLVSLYKDLRDDTATSYTLTVTVADNGSPSLTGTNTATVTVQVNRNLQPPRFINAPYSSTITRLVTDNSLLPGVTVSTADDDTVSPFRDVTVSVIGDDSAVSLFELVGSSVRVRNAANLAADTANTYKLRLLAEDGGSPRKTATTTIDITVRRNIVPPQFNPTAYNATILENYPVGSEIVTVSATDSDPQPPNNQFKYSITGDTTAMTYFYINPDSGRISLKQSIKGTGVNQFRLQVTATDEGTPPLSGQAIVTVDVTIDDTLRFTQLQPYIASIDENDPVDRGFITVIATPQPNIKYSIVGFSDSPDYFKIDENTGVISVKTDLRKDLSKRFKYLIQVRAEKQFPNGLQSVENLVNVTVLRNINAPVFNSTQYQANINEKYGLGQSVVQVFATDLDTQDVLLYSIIDQAGETEPFYMAPSTGIITLKQLLTGTTKARYAFTVRVRDQSKPERFGQSTVVINVRRNSQPPVFERTPYGAPINYNQAPGPVYTTSARDPDLTGTLTYEVIGYFSAPGYFTVNSNGEVILLSSLASDTALSYTLGLAAYDSDYPNDKAYANVTLTVNRNPNAPDFTNPSYSITVTESYPLAVSLLQVSGQDADQHVVEYILESSNPIDGTQFFYLNPSTGVLTVSRPLTETGTQTFTLQVCLRDNGIPARSSATTAPVTIFITRNNNGPIFAGTFTTSINETTPTSTAVLTVTATDSDPNTSPYGQLKYRIIGDGDFTQFFNIDATTGSILVQRPLTSQDNALYQGRIVAEDGGSPPRSATATAIINILRNINSPVFNPKNYSITIDETHQVGQNVITVTASDADRVAPNNQIVYTIINSKTAEFYYYLDPKTGHIYLKQCTTGKELLFVFNVTATDRGFPALSDNAIINVEIKECPKCKTNLHSPRFFAPIYFVNIREGNYSKTNLNLIQISATDDDDGNDGEILFDIQSVSNNGDDKFKLEQDQFNTNANVICSGAVNRCETYLIMVRASDQSFQMERRRHSTVPVEVRVVPFSTYANKCTFT
ncbi:protocadherin Fat 4-like [Crassostrea angulata]|uniref:protocadherin Fat 4-like n=1 Tax=Magallana angulata TaxID=2784310 RepID=UPI0022B1D785|nr:protocadherin Fat 4-like [Crassostrea angulata]